jgi:zinc protease
MNERMVRAVGSRRAAPHCLRLALVALTASACGASALPAARAVASDAAAAAVAPTDVEAWRRVRPPTGPLPSLHAPVAQSTRLENGLTLLSVQQSTLPLVRVTAIVKSGAAQDPVGAAGLAAFMADVLKMGTPSLTAEAIAEATETQGSGIEISVSEDAMTVSMTVLKQNLGPVLDVLADVLQHPTFAAHEMERARKLRLNTLSQTEADPVHLARRVFREVIFGGHAYGHTPLGTATALHNLRRKDLQGYYAAHVRPANMAILVVGDLTANDAAKAIGSRFGSWRSTGNVQAPPPPPKAQVPRTVLVPRPGAPQSQLVIGELGVARDTPDYYPLVMCNAILGGLFNSRLNMNLREDKGWTYGARSMLNALRQQGSFYVATGVRTDVTGPAIREVLKEVVNMRSTDVTEEELRNAKNRYSLSLPGYFQTVEGVADMMSSLYLYDLPGDYYQKLPEHLAAVTVADVRRVAMTYLHPDTLSIVVVGDPEHVAPALSELGRGDITRLDDRGHAIDAAAPHGKHSRHGPSAP